MDPRTRLKTMSWESSYWLNSWERAAAKWALEKIESLEMELLNARLPGPTPPAGSAKPEPASAAA